MGRPEKDHPAQLRAFANLLSEHPEYKGGEGGVRLVLIGGSRNEGDAARVEGLRRMAEELGVAVSFHRREVNTAMAHLRSCDV